MKTKLISALFVLINNTVLLLYFKMLSSHNVNKYMSQGFKGKLIYLLLY